MKPIRTLYNGNYFRSLLELRWAVFFDFLKTTYFYEMQGYDLGEAGWYVPDFWLPEVYHRRDEKRGIFLEIKGHIPTDEECNKCGYLAQLTGFPVIIAATPPVLHDYGCEYNELKFQELVAIHCCDGNIYPGGDIDMVFCQCDKCRSVGVTYSLRLYRGENECRCGGNNSQKTPQFLRALDEATRFDIITAKARAAI